MIQNKKLMILLIFVGVIFFGSGGILLWNYLHPLETQIAEVILDNQVIYQFDLSSAENQVIRIDAGNGYNLIQIQDGTICISEADCPDQTCVHMGTLKAENPPIVCLPHKLIIRFSEEEENF